jgi:riboflavin synthase
VFTGIVEDLGEVEAIEHAGDSARIFIRSAKVTEDARLGDSIAVNGVCLTVTGLIGSPAGADAPVASTRAPGAQAVASTAGHAPTPPT